MIEKLSIRNFKCFDKVDLALGKLTILAGTNSSGKSSIIQAILLLSHNVSKEKVPPLNSDIVSIGSFKEARNFITNEKEIEIAAYIDNKSCSVKIFEDDELSVKSVVLSASAEVNKVLNKSNGCINYLSANRIGHKDLYSKKYSTDHLIGFLGEYAIDYFQKNKSVPVQIKLQASQESETFSFQVNYWLKEILGCELITEDIAGTDSIKAQYSQYNSRPVRPRNVGSGISYLISILIVCLSAKENDLIIIENPEIHLHPKAQAKLADFFCFVSKSDIQILIETHSDHIFNGVRRNIKNKKLSVGDASLNFFSFDGNEQISKHHPILLDENGAVKVHHLGLFDQFSSDLDDLLGI